MAGGAAEGGKQLLATTGLFRIDDESFLTNWNHPVRQVEKSGAEAKAVKRRINTRSIYPPSDATPSELIALSSLDPAEQRFPGAQRQRPAAETRARIDSTRSSASGRTPYAANRRS